MPNINEAPAGFNSIVVRSDYGRHGPDAVAAMVRTTHCAACERLLALVMNYIGSGLADVEITCVCGTATGIAMYSTPRGGGS